MKLDMEGIMASAGSACTAGAMSASHVLTAIGLSEEEANSIYKRQPVLHSSRTEDHRRHNRTDERIGRKRWIWKRRGRRL